MPFTANIAVRVDKNHDFFNSKKSDFFYLNQIVLSFMILLIFCVEGGHQTSSNF